MIPGPFYALLSMTDYLDRQGHYLDELPEVVAAPSPPPDPPRRLTLTWIFVLVALIVAYVVVALIAIVAKTVRRLAVHSRKEGTGWPVR